MANFRRVEEAREYLAQADEWLERAKTARVVIDELRVSFKDCRGPDGRPPYRLSEALSRLVAARLPALIDEARSVLADDLRLAAAACKEEIDALANGPVPSQARPPGEPVA